MTTATLFDGRYEERKAGSAGEHRRPTAPELFRRGAGGPAHRPRQSGDPVAAVRAAASSTGTSSRPSSATCWSAWPPALTTLWRPGLRSPTSQASIGEVADQLYAMVAQSHLAVGADEDLEDRALAAAYSVLWELVELKQRARWNRFASLKDPAVWDAYLRPVLRPRRGGPGGAGLRHPHRPRHRRARPGLLPRVPRRPRLRPGLRVPDAAGHEHLPGVAGPVLPRRGPCPDAQRPPRRGAAAGPPSRCRCCRERSPSWEGATTRPTSIPRRGSATPTSSTTPTAG